MRLARGVEKKNAFGKRSGVLATLLVVALVFSLIQPSAMALSGQESSSDQIVDGKIEATLINDLPASDASSEEMTSDDAVNIASGEENAEHQEYSGLSVLSVSAEERGSEMSPLAGTPGYRVYKDADFGTLLGTYRYVKDAVEACGTDGAYTIVATGDDPDMGNHTSLMTVKYPTIPANKSITLTSDANGPYVLTLQNRSTAQPNGRHFYVTTGGTLTLQNINLEGLGLTSASGGADYNGGVYLNGANAQLIMGTGSVIKDCYVPGGGAGVNLNTSAILTMNGGEISNCICGNGNGAGLFINANSLVVMNSGAISNNVASIGAGVFIGTGSFMMAGGVISGNATTGGNGGGIYASSATANITITGGTIASNTAAQGGGVFLNGGTFAMDNGTIRDNDVGAGNGGGLRVNGGTVTLQDSLITGNSAGNGGGVYLAATATINATIDMYGGSIRNNTAATSGGGARVNGGTFTLHNGSISGNTTINGGGIYLVAGANVNGSLVMSGGSIDGNTASTSGGGVYLNAVTATFAMSAGEISNNRASGTAAVAGGGGVYTTDSAATNPASVTAYSNISIANTAVIGGNFAAATVAPPSNAGDFASRGTNPFDGQLLNNDDINYRNLYHAIVYKANNGTLEPNFYQTTSATGSTSVNLFTMYLAATGFTAPIAAPRFIGWNTQADGNGVTYSENTAITVNSSISLYAKWGLERYRVYKDTDMSTVLSSHYWMADAVAACGTDGAYAIVATEHDTDMTNTAGSIGGTVTIPSDKEITLISDGSGPYVISQIATSTSPNAARHFWVFGKLTLQNISLAGTGLINGANYNGGVYVSGTSAQLLMNSGAMIQYCFDVNGGGVCLGDTMSTLIMTGGSAIANNAAISGGGIHTADYDYADPVDIAKYANISIVSATLTGNKAVSDSPPPSNAPAFSTRVGNKFDGTLLNNDDINYMILNLPSLTITKTVAGEYGDRTRDFSFNMYMVDSLGIPLPSGTTCNYVGGIISGSGAALPIDGILTLDGPGKTTFALKHGQTITITGIDSDASVRIEEIDYSGYSVSYSDSVAGATISSNDTGFFLIAAGDRVLDFTNTKISVVPSGALDTHDGMWGAFIALAIFQIFIGATIVRCLTRRTRKGKS